MTTSRILISCSSAFALWIGWSTAMPAWAQPVAKVLEVGGKPQVLAADGNSRSAAVFGSLYLGEKLKLPAMSYVVIGFRKTGQLTRVSAGNQAVSADINETSVAVGQVGKKESIEVPRQTMVADTIDELSDLPTAGATILRGSPPTEPRLAILPVPDSAILETTPQFSWPEIPDAEGYQVVLRLRKDRLWSARCDVSSLEYPQDEEPLDPGKRYRVEVVPVGPHVSANGYEFEFAVGYPEDAEALESLASSDQPALVALAAIGYEQLQLVGQAIEQYQKLVSLAPQEAAFHAALADLYEQSGQQEKARQARRKAVELGFKFQDAEPDADAGAQQLRHQKMLELAQQTIVKLQHGKEVEPEIAADLLKWACELPIHETAIRRDAQLLATRVLWDVPTARAQQSMSEPNGKASDVAAQLQHDIRESERMLSDRGIPPPVARLGQLNLATFQFNWQKFDACQHTLDDLGGDALSPLVFAGTRARYWNLRGLLASERGEFALAFEHHSKALALRQQAGLPIDEAESLNNLGKLLLDLGDYESARKNLEAAQAIYSRYPLDQLPPHFAAASALTSINLSKALEAKRDFASSAQILRQVARQRDSAAEKGLADSICHNNLGLVLYQLGLFDESRRELERARRLACQLFGEDHIRTIESDVNLGWLELTEGNPQLAADRFHRAQRVLTEADPDHPRVAEIQGYLARVAAQNGQKKQAQAWLQRSLDQRYERLCRTLTSALSQRDRLAFVQKLRIHSESIGWPGVLDTFLELAPELEVSAEEQYQHVLNWKGILQSPTNDVGDSQAGSPAAALRSEWSRLRQELRRSLARGVMPSEELERRCNELERRVRKLQTAAPEVRSPSVNEIVSALTDHTVLLDVIETRLYQPRESGQSVRDNRIYVGFVIDKAGEVRRIDFGNAAEVDSAIESFVQRVSERRSYSRQARRLGKMLMDPILDQVDLTGHLIVSADGWLHRVPWPALPCGDEEFLVQKCAASMIASSRALVDNTRSAKPDAHGWLVVGGVDYGETTVRSTAAPPWQPLTSSLSEARHIDSLLKERFPNEARGKLLQGEAANKANLLSMMENRSFLHFATHGSFVDRQRDAFDIHGLAAQLDSFLVAAGANRAEPAAAAYLTAEEIGELDLRGTDVVTLSACETGLGHVRAGQGVIGLVSALRRAGADAIVSALWKVDDAATALFMQSFYSKLLDQERVTSHAALRQAQLDLMARSEGRYSHPFYWAAWSLSGGVH